MKTGKDITMYYFLFGFFLYAFALSFIIKRSKVMNEILGISLLIFITFMIGLRYGVGIDYFSYKACFDYRYDAFTYEPIYSLLMYVIKTLFDKFHYLTFTMIFLTNIFIFLSLKKKGISRHYLLLAILIYSSNTALIFMNLMRQGVAVAIFFYASNFINDRDFKKYLFFILIGAGFHFSILFLLPLYFIKNLNISKIKYAFLVVVAYILVYTKAAQSILNIAAYWIPMFSRYYNHSYIFNQDINLLSLGVLLNVVFAFFLLFVIGGVKKHTIDVNFYLIGIVINILSISSFMFDRIGIYFFIFGISAIPQLIRSIKNREVRRFTFTLSVLIALVLFTKSLLLNPELTQLEYKMIFSK